MSSTIFTTTMEQAKARLAELRPAHEEYLKLTEFVEKFASFFEDAAPAPAPAPSPARAPKASAPATRKRPSSGKAATKAAPTPAAVEETDGRHGATVAKIKEIVAAHPEGISVGNIISEGQLSTSYTYDVVKRLVDRGEFEKRNRKIYSNGESFRTGRKVTVTHNGDGEPAKAKSR